jgi:hypothetical protein
VKEGGFGFRAVIGTHHEQRLALKLIFIVAAHAAALNHFKYLFLVSQMDFLVDNSELDENLFFQVLPFFRGREVMTVAWFFLSSTEQYTFSYDSCLYIQCGLVNTKGNFVEPGTWIHQGPLW